MQLLNIKQAADHIGVDSGTLYRWRHDRREDRPPEIVVGSRLRWRKEELDQWLEERKATQ